jgi:hypothetical protein
MLMFVGPPGPPSACTCAAEHAPQPREGDPDYIHHKHGPLGHEPGCPAANPRPPFEYFTVTDAPSDLASDAAFVLSIDFAPHTPAIAVHSLCETAALPPHVPRFITFLALRN